MENNYINRIEKLEFENKKLKMEVEMSRNAYFQLVEMSKKLKESEFFFKESQSAASIGSYKTDFVKNRWESSETLDNIFGIDKKYTRSVKGWLDLVHVDDREMMRNYLTNTVVGERKPFNKEYRITRKCDGKTLWVLGMGKTTFDEKGNILTLIGTIQDISKRKYTEIAIEERTNIDEAMLNSIGDAVFACDNFGIILLFNKMAEKLTGYLATEAIGKHYNKIVDFEREDGSNDKNNFTEMSNHTILINKKGNKIPIFNSASPITDLNGKIHGVVIIFHDMTREYEIDKAKTEFVSLASHQLRTPLSTINWYSEMLLSEDVGKLSEKQKEYQNEVYHASQRMVNLVNLLLNVSRLELGTFSIEPKNINIAELSKNCLKEFTAQIKAKNILITQKYGNNLGFVNIDPKLLSIILLNILSNSVKYSKQKGKIILNISKKNNIIYISISDNGFGIPNSQQINVFEKMFRADNARKIDPDGTGLGLYIVSKITNYVGGKIWFKSKEDVGTTFYVNLPLAGMCKKSGTKQLL